MNKLKDLFAQISQLNYILTNKQKRTCVLIFFIMLISSGFELLGVAALLPFIETIMTPDVIMNNAFIKPVLDFFSITTIQGTVIFIGACVAVLYIIKNCYTLMASYFSAHFSTKVGMDLAVKMLNAYMKRPYVYFQNVNSAEVLRGVCADTGAVTNTLTYLYYLLTEVFAFIAIATYIIIMDWQIAIGTIAVLLITMALIITFFKPVSKRLGEKYVSSLTRQNKALLQITGGVKELYVTNRKDLFTDEYVDASNVFRRTQRNYTFIQNSPDRIVEGICVSGLIIVIIIRMFIDPENMANFIPKLAAFAMGAFKMLPSIGKITNKITSIIYGGPCVENVYKNLRESEEYEKKMADYVKAHAAISAGNDVVVKENFEDSIEIKNVVWQYDGADKPVLDGISLSVKRGDAIAFIGPSGSGKSTFADVILGLFQPQQGSVYMDGIDVYTMPATWAKIIGYVPQSVFLMDDTIRANVAFGVKDFTDEDVWKALDEAALGDFVRSLPEQLDTVVGERGVRFSGGQRQRVAIARALFAKPQILVLDEATSALDNEAEKAIMESIDALSGHMTLIIVAHRLTTIRNCDHIYRICDGKAVEQDKAEVLKDI